MPVPDSYRLAVDGSYGFAMDDAAPESYLISYKNPEEAQRCPTPDMSNRVPIKPLDDLSVDLAFYLFEKFITNKLSIKHLSQVSESWKRFIAEIKHDVPGYRQHSTKTLMQYGQTFLDSDPDIKA